MAYEKTVWKNGQSPAINSNNLNKIEKGIEDAHTLMADLAENKVDKVSGKGLSTNDYTTTEKNKLAGIAAGAQVNPTASQILTSLKTVDGDGSGLDADLLKGKTWEGIKIISPTTIDRLMDQRNRSSYSDRVLTNTSTFTNVHTFSVTNDGAMRKLKLHFNPSSYLTTSGPFTASTPVNETARIVVNGVVKHEWVRTQAYSYQEIEMDISNDVVGTVYTINFQIKRNSAQSDASGGNGQVHTNKLIEGSLI